MTLEELARTLDEQAERATPRQFIRRLENTVIIYAYLEKRFRERFPEAWAKWDEESGRRD